MFEAYSVAIRLRLIDSVSSGLIGMASQFAAFNRHVSQSQAQVTALEGQLKRLKMMGAVGGAAFGLGVAGLYSLKGPLEEAKAWQQEAAKFATLGFGDKVNRDAQSFAMGMKTYGTSARENLALLGDAMSVFKDLNHAELAAPILAKMKFGNEAIFGREGAAANERQFLDMLKVVELRRGLSSPAEFATQADFVQKAISGSRGRVNASQWLQLLKTGGVGVSQMGNESFYLGLEPLLQEFGGFRLGTSLMSVYQNLTQARGTISAQQELYRLGLLDPKKVQFNQLGQVKKALPGAFLGSAIFEKEGPLALLEKVLIPAFAKHGITTEPQILDELGRILSNRTASSILARTYQQRGSIAMQAAANVNAQGISALVQTGQNTPDGKWMQMVSQYHNLLLQLGTAVLPIAVKAVEGLTFAVQKFIAFGREFPTLTKGIVIAFATLSGLMAVGGAVTLATVGFRALGLAFAVTRGVGLGATLISAAGGLASFGAALGPVAAVLGSAAFGYALGKLINYIGPDHDLGGYLGGKLHDLTDWWTGENEKIRTTPPRSAAAVPGGKSAGVTVISPIHLDGRKIAEVVTRHQARSGNAPQTGAMGFDDLAAPAPAAGATGSW